MVDLIQDPLGYLRVTPLPSEAELAAHYEKHYYLGGKVNSYDATYDALELEHKTIPPREALHIWNASSERVGRGPCSMLDAGCGEGYAMQGFADAGWTVAGIDFTSDGIDAFNPQLKDRLICGDLYVEMKRLAAEGKRFDFIMCNNVLEHVREPADALRLLRDLVSPGGMLRVQVPNDGSWLQDEIVKANAAAERFWMAYPDHLSYFTIEPLAKLGCATGWTLVHGLGDFPIDLFLLNPNSNYMLDRGKGKASHRVRILVETLISRQGLGRLVAFRDGCMRAGLGRSIIAYFEAA